MKVDILTVDEMEIGRFSWWTKWIDIAVFDYSSLGNLLQMKVSRDNGKKFRVVPFKEAGNQMWCGTLCAGDLVQMKGREKGE